jgi:putative heme-binding domain-containing protein
MAGFLEAYQGREVSNLPPELAAAIQEYQASIGQSDIALALRLGQADAVDQALQIVSSDSADAATRLLYIEILGQIGEQRAIQPLLGLLGSSSSGVKRAAMLALMGFSDDVIGSTICNQYQSSIQDEHGLRETAQRVLASRPNWTRMLLREVDEFRIKAEEVSSDVVQQMRLHQDEEIQSLLDKHFGRTRSTPEERQEQISRLASLLRTGLSEAAGSSDAAEDSPVVRGYQVFKKNCAVCHTLFDEGGQTGPNLTGYERDNLDFMLLAIVDPSAAIREEFTNYQVATLDGLILTGLIDEQTPTTVTLRGAKNETTIINREDIDVLQALDISIMPDALTQKMTDQDLVDLFAYLVRRTPIPVELRGTDEETVLE